MMLILGVIIGLLVGFVASFILTYAIICWNCANSDNYYAAFNDLVNSFRE